ncbi:MAG: mannose-6-phosphate isomerase, class I [Chitinophagaceae bacterium]|nr:mannose-6-phosphate isomerase, class I [Chitinophagaceae bacterium]
MQNNTKIFRLEGKVQHYAWGGNEYIPSVLAQNNPDKKPFAEYWMGAHVNAPALVVTAEGKVPLDEFIAQDPATKLGKKVNDQFGRLPYLLKVLDVKDMLSIQVHPTKAAAVAEFAAENEKGIALNDPKRNYKDDNHKPELMLALSDFWLLHGFRRTEETAVIIGKIPELNFLIPFHDQQDHARIYKHVMSMPQEEVNQRLQPLLDRIIPLYKAGKLEKTDPDFWAARAAITFNEPGRIDRGIFSIYLFNLVRIEPDYAIFQDAGVPHAYLEGQNMEIMANSDNVLRGGLTNKHVDVDELMKHVKFTPVEPELIMGSVEMETPEGQYAETRFKTPAPDFELRQIWLPEGEQLALPVDTTDIFFALAGKAEVKSGDTTIELNRGEALLALPGADLHVKAIGDEVVIFRATAGV